MSSLKEIIKSRKAELLIKIDELGESKKCQVAAIDLCNDSIAYHFHQVYSIESYGKSIDKENLENEEFNSIEMAGLLVDERFMYLEFPFDSQRESLYSRAISFVRSQLFVVLMNELEDFFSELLLLILKAYPERLGDKNLELTNNLNCTFSRLPWVYSIEQTLGLSSSEELLRKIDSQINEVVRKIMYANPQSYQKDIGRYLEIKDDFLWDRWILYREMKARRDAGSHHSWNRDEYYDKVVEKLKPQLENIKTHKEIYDPIPESDFLGIDIDYFKQSHQIVGEFINKYISHCLNHFKTLEDTASAD